VGTAPSRARTCRPSFARGGEDFEETLFLRCDLYCATGKPLVWFESFPFLLSVVAADAVKLDSAGVPWT
jgi:hypothetical protein